jgi:uncharacterized membrane protein YgaE (UPF0421/DUF939 family)
VEVIVVFVVILLAIIAATLLFGSAAVRNVIGVIAGLILGVIALSIGGLIIAEYWTTILAGVVGVIFVVVTVIGFLEADKTSLIGIATLAQRKGKRGEKNITPEEEEVRRLEKELQSWYDYKSDLKQRKIPGEHIGWGEADTAIASLTQRIKDARH